MSRRARLDLIRQIQRKRSSKVVTYVTSDRPNLTTKISGDVIPVMERHFRALCGARTKKLDLLIYSRGGDSNVPWALVTLVREFLGERSFGVLVPFRAHSAATVIALGADEIVMTKAGELGPIDATIEGGPHNPREVNSNQRLPISVEDTTGYFNFLQSVGLEDPDHKMEAFRLLVDKVHPLALGSVHRLLSQTERVARELLSRRNVPLSDDENEEIVRHLSSEIHSHEHAIRRGEARGLGLQYILEAENEHIDRELWDLYEAYAELLQLQVPFAPNDELIEAGLEHKEWQGLRLACVESTHQCDIYTFDMQVRRLREVPPTVNFSLQNVALAVPDIPAGLDEAQVKEFINNVASKMIDMQVKLAADRAREELIKALPSKGFEQVMLNSSWKKETSGD